MQKYIHLNDLKIFGTSLKKLDASSSFAVAPHVMLIENMCARIAQLRWKERPPRKIIKKGSHLKFSISAPIKLFSPRR